MGTKIERVSAMALACLMLGTAFRISAQCCGTVNEVQKADEATVKNQELSKAEEKAVTVAIKLPKMLELGSVGCKACKKMEPVVNELKKNYSDKLLVEFVDVMQNPQIGEKYNLKTIPTQIFLDADGKEVFRHTGFFSKEEIISKWKEIGYDLEKK
jgi:thioredoxin 1